MSAEFKVALFRGLLTAALVAVSGFLAMWSTTSDTKTLIIAAATPAVAVLMARFGVEGAIDSRRAAGSAAPGG